MNDFAAEGLRTLMFAMKELDSSIDAASLKDKDEKTLASEMEKDLDLLGVTGLDDELQDNVASCIKDFKTANIKMWMLTGDKEETAKNIAVSCGFIDQKCNKPITIDGETQDSLNKQFTEGLKVVEADKVDASVQSNN